MEKQELRVLLESFLNPKEKDLNKLFQARDHTSIGSGPRAKIEAQIAAAVEEEKDLEKLIQARSHTLKDSDPGAQIEAQIAAVVREVTIDNIPACFEKQLRNPSFPSWVLDQLRQRAKEILLLLEG